MKIRKLLTDSKLTKNRMSITNDGFTIVELMIATVVFSSVLLVLTFGIIDMSKTYYKGINITNTQNVARNVLNDITQNIEFSGGAVGSAAPGASPNTDYAFCIGNRAYFYRLGDEIGGSGIDSTKDALMVYDNDSNCPNVTAPNLKTGAGVPSGAQEMLEPKMRLTTLEVAQNPSSDNLYNVIVQVSYGDDGLLNNYNSVNNPDVTCKDGSGQQFCATAVLSTTIGQRVK